MQRIQAWFPAKTGVASQLPIALDPEDMKPLASTGICTHVNIPTHRYTFTYLQEDIFVCEKRVLYVTLADLKLNVE